jgi:hypothetical protein
LRTYQHGCSDPVACTVDRHKTKECRQPCKAQEALPAALSARLHETRHALAPAVGGVMDVDVKSQAGRRGIRLPDQLFALLMEHEKTQANERELATDLWHESEFMFTQPTAAQSTPAPTTTSGRRCSPRPKSETLGCTRPTHRSDRAAPARFHCPPSWRSWAGPTARSPSGTPHVTAAIQNSIAAQVNTLLWGPQ